MKNTTVIVVGVGLVGGLAGLALYAGRSAAQTDLAAPPQAPSVPTGMPGMTPPSPGLAAPPPGMPPGAPYFGQPYAGGPGPGQLPPGAVPMGQLPPGARMGPPPPGAMMSGGGPGGPTAMLPGSGPTPGKGAMQVAAARLMRVEGARELQPYDIKTSLETVLPGLAGCFEKTNGGKEPISADLVFEGWASGGEGTVRNANVTRLAPEDAALRTCLQEQLDKAKFRATSEGAMRFELPLKYALQPSSTPVVPDPRQGAMGGQGGPGAAFGGPPMGGQRPPGVPAGAIPAGELPQMSPLDQAPAGMEQFIDFGPNGPPKGATFRNTPPTQGK